MIEKIRTETEEFQKKLSNITSDEQALDSRIDRRQREYDQLQKRLATLQVSNRFPSVNPMLVHSSPSARPIWTSTSASSRS